MCCRINVDINIDINLIFLHNQSLNLQNELKLFCSAKYYSIVKL